MPTSLRAISWTLFGLALAGCHGGSDSSAPAPTVTKTATNTPVAKAGGSATRRSVKTATDPGAAQIDQTAKDTTIEEIVAQKAPGTLEGRAAPFETTTWRVKATLASVQLMKDNDYYLVMKGDKGGETVVEVPDPAECTGSPLEPAIALARKEIEDKYHPTKTIQTINQPAVVTGVGFLGWGNARKGTRKGAGTRSGPRLMPGTGFEFGP